jgi:hypothetical protein
MTAVDDASLRASDDDREQAVMALRDHLLAGRLTLEEFSERVDGALRAKVTAELTHVQDDLPQVVTELAGSRRKPVRFTMAVLGRVVRRGQLRLHRRAVALSVLGDLDLDLRDATVGQRHTTVTVLATCGNVDIYVPESVSVDVGGLAILGHHRDWGRDAGSPGAPSIHVRVLGFAGTVDVWRVPHEMHASSYSDIFQALEGGRRQLRA